MIKHIILKHFILTVVGTLVLQGCTTAPERKAIIEHCSREANAYSPSTRIGNDAYWSCLDRLEKAQARQEQLLEQRAYITSLQSRCDSFGFTRGTIEHSNCMMVQKREDDVKQIQEAHLREQAAERRRKALKDYNDALKPHPLPNQCPEFLNAKPGSECK